MPGTHRIAGTFVVQARRLRRALPAASALAASCLAWFLESQIATAQMLLPIELTDLHGAHTTLSKAAGRPMVVNIWATWCPPCRAELPIFARAASERPDIAFAFVNAGESADVVRDFLRAERISLPRVLLDRSKAVARYYGINGYPATLVTRADGTLVVSLLGQVTQVALSDLIRHIDAR